MAVAILVLIKMMSPASKFDLSAGAITQTPRVKVATLTKPQTRHLGLTDAICANPNCRYASQLDRFDTEHTQVQLTHFIASDIDVTTRVIAMTSPVLGLKLTTSPALKAEMPSLLEVLTRPDDERNQRFYQVLTGQADSTSRDTAAEQQ